MIFIACNGMLPEMFLVLFLLGFFLPPPIALLGNVSVEKEIHYEQNSPIKCHLFG